MADYISLLMNDPNNHRRITRINNKKYVVIFVLGNLQRRKDTGEISACGAIHRQAQEGLV